MKAPFKPDRDNGLKKVLHLDLKGDIVNTFPSVVEASRNTGVSKTCIARVCRGERGKNGGYAWHYAIEKKPTHRLNFCMSSI